jgi:hypothetical protein
MTRRDMRIDRLVLRLPRARAPAGTADAAALARGLVAGALQGSDAPRGARSGPGAASVRVVQRGRGTQAELIETVARALGRALE